jgi:hypothetical protein
VARITWSEETIKARAEAGEAIDKMLRLMNKDRNDAGHEEPLEDYPEFANGLTESTLTGWIVAGQFQHFGDPEVVAVVHGASQMAATTKSGLAGFAADYWA